jgi:hypothetical protein
MTLPYPGPTLAPGEREMMNHPIKHSWTVPNPGKRINPPRAYSRYALPEGTPNWASSPSDVRVAARLGAISTRVLLASLLGMGAIGSGVLFLMHSLTTGDPSRNELPGTAEVRAPVAPTASVTPSSFVLTPIPLVPPGPPSSGSQASTTTRVAVLAAAPTATFAPPSSPRVKVAPRWHMYPVPVFAPPTAKAQLPPENPFGGRD